MPDTTQVPIVHRFGAFEINLQSGELRKNGMRLRLSGQPFQVLAVLVERAGEVVTREELHSKLWPADTFVDFDHGLNNAIARIRETLADSSDTPRYVETIPRRGYRFIAPVVDVLPATVAPPTVESEISATHKVTRPSEDHPPMAAIRVPRLQKRWPFWAGGALAMLLVGLAVAWLVWHGSGPKPELTEQRLTFNPPDNQVNSAAISPNGKYLAYSELTGVSLRLIETGQIRKLFAIKEGAGITRLAWFPDGTRLLASGNTDPEDASGIWVTSILGEAPRKLRAAASFAAVSPDGAQIAFVNGEGLDAIWVMGARGEEQRRIAVYEDSSIAMPVWSPDGRRIAYIRDREDDTTTIESLDLNGGPAVPVVSDPRLRFFKGGFWATALCWSPDGRIIYQMSSSQKTGETDLWALRVDPRTGKPYGKPDRITSWGGSFFVGLDVTADGKRLAVLRAHAQPSVWVGDIREKATQLVAQRRLTVEDSDDMPSSWTPDGKAVLFSSNRDGRSHIFRQAIDKTRAEAVTAGTEDDLWPVVTPDGSWILYELVPSNEVFRRQSHRLMRVPVLGGPPQFVADLLPGSGVRCARLPSTLCVLGEPGPKQLIFYALDPVNGRGRELARTDATGFPHWDLSADGSRIGLCMWEVERGRMRILDLAARSARDLELKGQHGLSQIAWSADGRGLFVRAFSHWDSSERRLLYVGLDGAVRVLSQTISTSGPWCLTPSPDGRHLAWAESTWDANAWMLENF